MSSLPSRVPNVLGNTSLTQFDAVIIGSGAGGSTVARVLATNGLKVCIIEFGNNYFLGLDDPAAGNPIPLYSNDEVKLTSRNLISQQLIIEPRTFRTAVSDGDRILIGDVNTVPKTVGGAAVHADCKYPRYDDFDFQIATAMGQIPPGTNFADWPFTYDEIEPFYAAAERIVGVQGLAGANPFESPRSGPFPMPPGPPMYGATVLADGARKLGYTPHPFPSGMNSQVYRGRPPCNDCGFCSGFGCPNNSKSSPAVTVLRDALLTGNVQVRYNSIATRITTSNGGQHATGVDYLDPDGNPAHVAGDRVVISANSIESARLCLLSDLGGPGLGNSSDMVGRNIMFHLQTTVVGIYPQRFHGERGRSITTAISDFRGVPNDPNHPLGGIIETGAVNSRIIQDAQTYLLSLGQIGTALKPFLRTPPFGAHLNAMTMQAEDAPQVTNRVDLDPDVKDINGLPVPRVTYKSNAFELASRNFYAPKMLDIHQASGAQFGFVSPIFDGGQTPTSAHNMGTLRMGNDPGISVTDGFGKFHDLDNLYAADGSLFPSSGGHNPTLTIHACALRVGGAIVNPQSPGSVIEKGL
ncbi:MAG TPA: GMC family oxidoreductase [Candidatus Bathyarchaeia archaeon]|nr:GMC family oxidoreductase [Candidatus Bathyarchaeia archaeon]